MINKEAKEILDEMDLSGCPWVKDNLIFLTLAGSRSYGTHTETSDYDYRGICIPPTDYFMGLKSFDQAECRRTDTTIYSIKKFIKLLIDCNPNIIELLFANEENIVYKHPIMDVLLNDKEFWLSKRAKNTFLGYATSQLKRIEGHKKWIDNPVEEPKRGTWGIAMDKSQLNALRIFANHELLNMGLSEHYVTVLREEQKYATEMQNYKNYKQWMDHRNETRAALEALAGYDTKHAMHLIRLLNMALEIAMHKNINVKRPDADFLREIRNGKYDYEWIIKYAELREWRVKKEFEESDLKDRVDVNKASNILWNMVMNFHSMSVGLEPEGVVVV